MRIALDYDGVVTEDPAAWLVFVKTMQHRGHSVFLVTNRGYGWNDPDRFPVEEVQEAAKVLGVMALILCGPRAKRNSITNIDVWIDDHPEWIDGGPWLESKKVEDYNLET